MTNKIFKHTINHLKTGMYFIDWIKFYKTPEIEYNIYHSIRSINIVGEMVYITRSVYENGRLILLNESIHRKYIQDIYLDKIWWFFSFNNYNIKINEDQIKLKFYNKLTT